MPPTTHGQWVHLVRRPDSCFRQLHVRGTDLLAFDLFTLHADPVEPTTNAEIAAAFEVPLAAVEEAIAYCSTNPEEICNDFADQDAFLAARGLLKPEMSKKHSA